MNINFVRSCDKEISNNIHKGDWEEWHPTKKELIKEINWHMAKLSHALLSDNNDLIREYSCDVANLCEKAYDEFGISLDDEFGISLDDRSFLESRESVLGSYSTY